MNFQVEFHGNATKITNDSDMNLFIYVTPIPPKRKHRFWAFVEPKSFMIWDGLKIDLEKINFRFQKKDEK